MRNVESVIAQHLAKVVWDDVIAPWEVYDHKCAYFLVHEGRVGHITYQRRGDDAIGLLRDIIADISESSKMFDSLTHVLVVLHPLELTLTKDGSPKWEAYCRLAFASKDDASWPALVKRAPDAVPA